MLLSIITPTYNSEKSINDCLNSVSSCMFDSYEHIIIDNVSKDNTLKIIHNFQSKKIKVLTKKDKGIYNAMNIGAKLARGKYIMFLNSDDIIINNKFFKTFKKIISDKNIDILYSNIIYQKNFLNIARKYLPGKFTFKKILNGWHPPHTGLVVKRNFFLQFMYDEQFHIASDYDFFIKVFNLNKIKVFYYNKINFLMGLGGKSDGFFGLLKGNYECYKSLKKNKYKKPVLIIIKKIFFKITQFYN